MSNKFEGFIRKLERYPLPPTTNGVCASIREILDKGCVQRIEMYVNESTIRVERMVRGEDLQEDSVSWDVALRSLGVIPEWVPEGSVHRFIIMALRRMSIMGRHAPVCWVTGLNETGLLDKWVDLAVEFPLEDLCGLPIYRIAALPEETLMLCGSVLGGSEPDDIGMAAKITMELRSE